LSRKIAILSYESSTGRTTLAKGLFDYVVSKTKSPVQLMGYDIEKPDLIQVFDKVKFTAEEVFASFPKIDNLRCKFCGACISFCDCGALHLDRNIPAMLVNPERCEACGECIEGCSIHGIQTREKLTGYVLQGRLNGHAIILGKAEDSHDFLVPLVCALNQRIKPGSISICDLGPGISGYVAAALKETSLALIVLKPARGWERNTQFLLSLLKEKAIPVGIVINKYRNESGFLDEVKLFCSTSNASLMGVIPFESFEPGEKSLDINAFSLKNESIFASILEQLMSK
jgi:MinD superfamily P-loop ATPase